MKEVIGRKSIHNLLFLIPGGFFVVIGIVFIPVAIVSNNLPIGLIGVFGLGAGIISLAIAARVCKYPKELVFLDGQYLIFAYPKNEIDLLQVKRIEAYIVQNQYDYKFTHGTILVTDVNGNIYKQNNIAELEKVVRAIIAEAKRINPKIEFSTNVSHSIKSGYLSLAFNNRIRLSKIKSIEAKHWTDETGAFLPNGEIVVTSLNVNSYTYNWESYVEETVDSLMLAVRQKGYTQIEFSSNKLDSNYI